MPTVEMEPTATANGLPTVVFSLTLRVAPAEDETRALQFDELIDELLVVRLVFQDFLGGRPNVADHDWPRLAVTVRGLRNGSAIIDLVAQSAPGITLLGLGVAIKAVTEAVTQIAQAAAISVQTREQFATKADRLEAERRRRLADIAMSDADRADAELRERQSEEELEELRRRSAGNPKGPKTIQVEIRTPNLSVNWDQIRESLPPLARANEIRLARAQLKRAIASGEVSVATVLREMPSGVERMEIGEVVSAQRRWGGQRTRRLLSTIPVVETKLVGALTERQRLAIADRLDDQGLGVV